MCVCVCVRERERGERERKKKQAMITLQEMAVFNSLNVHEWLS